ncbi:MAG: hypothetical protein AAFM92_03070 [Pseudomonadota bacterium]
MAAPIRIIEITTLPGGSKMARVMIGGREETNVIAGTSHRLEVALRQLELAYSVGARDATERARDLLTK